MSRPVPFEFTTIPIDAAQDAESIRARLPAQNGVFRIFDVHDRLILLDKTHHLAHRIERFFAGEDVSRDLDLREITGRIEFCRTDSPFETLYLLHNERRRWFPKTYRKMKTFPLPRLLEIDPNLRFPRLEVVQRALPGRWTFGPFRSRSELEKLKSDLERTFRLRPCDYDIRGDDPYPDCIYFQMRTCSKPCNGDIDRRAYMADVRAARDFIEGREGRLLADLDTWTRELSEELRFEEAAEVRKRAERVREARRSHKATHFRIEDFHAIVLLNSGSVRKRKVAQVRGGRIERIEEHETRTMAGTLEAASESETVEADRYEDFCLVSRFLFRPLESVRVFPYRDETWERALSEALARAGAIGRDRPLRRPLQGVERSRS